MGLFLRLTERHGDSQQEKREHVVFQTHRKLQVSHSLTSYWSEDQAFHSPCAIPRASLRRRHSFGRSQALRKSPGVPGRRSRFVAKRWTPASVQLLQPDVPHWHLGRCLYLIPDHTALI